jgi:DNA helicase II / ATP-dependent DNA helicase PcrA
MSPRLDPARDLNPDQLAAVTHGEGPQLVIAGAGSGKTRVITYRVAWLVEEQDVDPAHIAAVTFTNKAAAEMRERVESLLRLYPLPTFVGTFHRWSLVLLRRYGERLDLSRDFAILDTSDQLKLIKDALKAEGMSDKSFAPRSVLSAISGAKNQLIGPDEYERMADGFFARKVAPVYRRYQFLLRQNSGVDFDDMIAYAVKLLETDEELRERLQRRTEYLLVDEFQDTNHAQLRLVAALTGPGGNLTAVGDEDQGIYRWRGADLDNILGFEKTFPGATIRKLEQNYRSTQNILDASGGLVARNKRRRGKRLWTEAGAGPSLTLYKATDEEEEARWIVRTLRDLRSDLPWSEMAILVRTNAQTRALEEELLRSEVPYVLVGGTRFYERAEIKDVVAYLRFLRNPRDTFSLQRILNQPPRGIGKTTAQMLEDEARSLRQPLWDVIRLGEYQNFPGRSANAVRAFRDLIVDLREAAEDLPLPQLLEKVLHDTKYYELFDREDPDGLARLENLEELLSAAQSFTETLAGGVSGSDAPEDQLTAFLDHVSLVSDIDSWQPGGGVSVMTLHSAKGLEFEAVFVAGLEDGLLPHFNAQGTEDDVEEERRLLYVGMTRARERLYLSCCRRRRIAGRYQPQDESEFLDEIPADALDVVRSPSLFEADRSSSVRSFFGGGSGPSPYRSRGSRHPLAGGDGGEGLEGIGKGSRVSHPVLGEGVILEVDGSGGDAKVTVFFDGAGKRRLIARYANLEPA